MAFPIGISLGQWVFAEQIAHAHDGIIHLLQVCALHNENQVTIAQQEGLTLKGLDKVIQSVHCDANMMLAPVLGLQPRQMDMHAPATVAMTFQSLSIIEKQIFLAGRIRLLCHWSSHPFSLSVIYRNTEFCIQVTIN